jgi:dTMP kinase
MVSAPGRLIALEGIDGCGKSTQARLLAERLGALLTFEPGDTALGVSLRPLVLDPDRATVAPLTEALLMAADRAQHVIDVVRPALERGTWVVTDRYSASTLAYQGYGRGLDLGDLARLMEWATAGLAPDLYVLVEVDLAVGQARRRGSTDDRMERQDDGFRQRVANGYRRLADGQDTPWLVVDGTGPIEAVATAVWSGVRKRLGEGP